MAESESERVVMIPVDASANSERAFDFYVGNISRPNDKVLLFNVYEVQNPTSFVFLGDGGYDYDTDQWDVEIERAKKSVEDLKEKYKKKCEAAGNLKYEFKVHVAPTGQSIVDAAKENGAKLIVMGTRGLGTIRRTFLGSVSDYVVHHCDLPITVVP